MSKRNKQVKQGNDVEVGAPVATAVHCGLSMEQARALAAFRHAQGRFWKAALLELWHSGRDVLRPDGALLRQIRNSLGPRWLQRYRPEAAAAQLRAAGPEPQDAP